MFCKAAFPSLFPLFGPTPPLQPQIPGTARTKPIPPRLPPPQDCYHGHNSTYTHTSYLAEPTTSSCSGSFSFATIISSRPPHPFVLLLPYCDSSAQLLSRGLAQTFPQLLIAMLILWRNSKEACSAACQIPIHIPKIPAWHFSSLGDRLLHKGPCRSLPLFLLLEPFFCYKQLIHSSAPPSSFFPSLSLDPPPSPASSRAFL